VDGVFDAAELLRSCLDACPVAPPLLGDGRPAPESVRRRFDGSATLRELLPALDPPALAELFGTLVWLDRPLGPLAPGPERCLALSAAPEDALLSMGGYLLKRRGLLNCLHAVCFGDAPERHDEATLIGTLAGVRSTFLRLPDASARGSAPFAIQPAEHRMLRSLTMLVYALIERERPTNVFAPAAIGIDRDRELVCEAVRRIFEAGYFPDVAFHLYEALPAADAHIEVDAFLSAFENSYVRAAEWLDDVTPVAERKRRLAAVIRAPAAGRRDAVLRAVGRRNGLMAQRPDGEAERFWTLRLTFAAA